MQSVKPPVDDPMSIQMKPVGSIEKGKVADFVIMEDDLFKMSEDKISSVRIWKTYFNDSVIARESDSSTTAAIP